MNYIYPAIFYPENNGQYSVIFPDFNNLVTYGDDLPDAFAMATEACGQYFLHHCVMIKNSPMPSSLDSIDDKNAIVNIVYVNLDTYAHTYINQTDMNVGAYGTQANMCKAWRDQFDLGRLSEIFDSVQSGDYGVDRGSQKANMSVPEFEKAMEAAGYKLPTLPAYEKPIAYNSLTKEQFDAGTEKSMEDIKAGRVYSVDEVEAEMKWEFGKRSDIKK